MVKGGEECPVRCKSRRDIWYPTLKRTPKRPRAIEEPKAPTAISVKMEAVRRRKERERQQQYGQRNGEEHRA